MRRETIEAISTVPVVDQGDEKKLGPAERTNTRVVASSDWCCGTCMVKLGPAEDIADILQSLKPQLQVVSEPEPAAAEGEAEKPTATPS